MAPFIFDGMTEVRDGVVFFFSHVVSFFPPLNQDNGGSDAGLALDDVQVTATFVPPPQTIVIGTVPTQTENVNLTPGSLIVTSGGALQVQNQTIIDELVTITINGQCQAPVGQSFTVLESNTPITGGFSAATLNCSDPCRGASLQASVTSISVVVNARPCRGGLSTGVIVGIAVGGAVLAAIVIVLVILFMQHRRKQDASDYYAELEANNSQQDLTRFATPRGM